MASTRLALGTAQLGMPYGIAGRGRAPSEREVEGILEAAVGLGVTAIDTAPVYGRAEQRIGRFLGAQTLAEDFCICTKLPSLGAVDPCRLGEIVAASFTDSLRRLGCEHIDSYLIHDIADLHYHGERLVDALLEQRALGRVRDVGVSVYEPDDLDALARYPGLSVVQHPFSLLDRRLRNGDSLRQLRVTGVKLQLRSVLLQGLLGMHPDDAPAGISGARDALLALRGVLAELELPLPQAALAYTLSLGAERLVVGVDSAEQLAELVAAAELAVPGELDAMLDAALGTLPPGLIDPRTWPPAG